MLTRDMQVRQELFDSVAQSEHALRDLSSEDLRLASTGQEELLSQEAVPRYVPHTAIPRCI